MFFWKSTKQNKRKIAMSIVHSTTFIRKFKHVFLECNIQKKCSCFDNWPARMPYNAWQKQLKRDLCQIKTKKPPLSSRLRAYTGRSRRYWKFLRANIRIKNEIVKKQAMTIINELEARESTDDDNVKLELITMLKQFLKTKHIAQHIEETIPDRRNPDLITYSKQSIMMSALSIFLFRMESGNKYDNKSHDADEKYSMTNIAKFIEAPDNRAPVIKTIEKFFKNLEEESVNDLMIAFFKDLQRSKFFSQHPQIMPGDFFLLAADCVHTHTYDHPHHTDVHGINDCQCCLKRVYNKGTENEKVRWFHNTLVFSFIFMGGLKIPIYRYPIHAKQIINLESASEEAHKQECEIVALKAALPVIRQSFPKMHITLLLDGLYANRPTLRLAEEYRCGYIIVRKNGCLPSLGKDCDERAKQLNHQKNCVKRSQSVSKKWLIEQKYEWFNSMYLGGNLSTNVLRFSETRTREGEDVQSYKCEWLFSKKLSVNTCESAAVHARARWGIEDVFNTTKNRGFNLKHDYSRDPRSCFNWHGIALFAFGIFELFRFSEGVKQRGNLPQITLAEKLQGQLFHKPTEEIFSDRCLLKKIQFRYNFVIEFNLNTKTSKETGKELLNTG
jgi:hypothetical protein